jgi:predicted GNAT family N-acyltransferase
MPNIEVRRPTHDELATVQQLRHEVLDPARVIDEDHELGPQDFLGDTIHMAAFLDSTIVGTVRLDLVKPTPPTYEVRKMAVDPAYRKRGIGKSVLRAALLEIEQTEGNVVTLDSRESAVPFFESLGFELTGERIVHADGVPNYVMTYTAVT